MSNLLDKASIVTTPTAYENGKILSVKPAPSLSSELVTNGDFSTDTNWSKINSTISGGTGNLNGTGVTSMLYQNILTSGKTYKVTFTVSDYNSLGEARIIESSGSAIYTITSNGTFTFTFTHSNADGNFLFRARNGAIFSVDNTSVKEVIDGDFDFTRNSSATRVNSQGLIEDVQILSSNLVSNGDFSNGSTGWSFSNDGGSFGWRIANERAICDAEGGGNGRNLNSSTTLVNGKTYKLTLDILQSVDGMNVLVGSTVIPNELPTGTNLAYEYYIEASQHSGGLFSIYGGSSDLQEIDNISVIEITDDTNLPRIDYTGGVGHWLFEPQSTNMITYSEDYSNSFYVKDSGVSVGTSDNSSPSINPTATKIDVTNNGRIYANIATNTYYSTVFIKSGTFSHFKFAGSNIDLIAETNSNGTIQSFGNGWYRIGIPYTGNRPFQVQAYPDGTYSNHTTSGNYFIWGTQSEVQSFATSYIPTNGAISTRLKDAAFGAGSSDLINSTEGVLYAEIAALANDGTYRSISISDSSRTNIIEIDYTNDEKLRVLVKSANVSVFSVLFVLDITIYTKLAVKYKLNDFEVFINGIKEYTITNGAAPIGLSELAFDRGDGGTPFSGKVKSIAVFKEALTDAELTCLTTI
tara:strand:+ start:118 stop:2028 length:1911 start_codon:yes stop_codon:yes gene_type:complete